MKIWLDDLRSASQGYVHYRSVNEAIRTIEKYENKVGIELLIAVNDLGDYAYDG